jgi:hypothetical protein
MPMDVVLKVNTTTNNDNILLRTSCNTTTSENNLGRVLMIIDLIEALFVEFRIN